MVELRLGKNYGLFVELQNLATYISIFFARLFC